MKRTFEDARSFVLVLTMYIEKVRGLVQAFKGVVGEEPDGLRTRRSESGVIRTGIANEERFGPGSRCFRRTIFGTPAQLLLLS